jgi:hypothetical protein
VRQRAFGDSLRSSKNFWGVVSVVVRQRLTAFLDQAALEMMRAQGVIDLAERSYLDSLVQINYRVSTHLLAEELDTTHQLTWLGQVGVRWGCLGLWTESDSDGPPALMVAGFYSRDTNTETLLGNRYVAAHFPQPNACPYRPAAAVRTSSYCCPCAPQLATGGCLHSARPLKGI